MLVDMPRSTKSHALHNARVHEPHRMRWSNSEHVHFALPVMLARPRRYRLRARSSRRLALAVWNILPPMILERSPTLRVENPSWMFLAHPFPLPKVDHRNPDFFLKQKWRVPDKSKTLEATISTRWSIIGARSAIPPECMRVSNYRAGPMPISNSTRPIRDGRNKITGSDAAWGRHAGCEVPSERPLEHLEDVANNVTARRSDCCHFLDRGKIRSDGAALAGSFHRRIYGKTPAALLGRFALADGRIPPAHEGRSLSENRTPESTGPLRVAAAVYSRESGARDAHRRTSCRAPA